MKTAIIIVSNSLQPCLLNNEHSSFLCSRLRLDLNLVKNHKAQQSAAAACAQTYITVDFELVCCKRCSSMCYPPKLFGGVAIRASEKSLWIRIWHVPLYQPMHHVCWKYETLKLVGPYGLSLGFSLRCWERGHPNQCPLLIKKMRTTNVCSLIVYLLSNFGFKLSVFGYSRLHATPQFAILYGMVAKKDQEGRRRNIRG